jgi:hypothetical protein
MSTLTVHRRHLHDECERAAVALHLATGIERRDLPTTSAGIADHLLLPRAAEIAARCERAAERIAAQWSAAHDIASLRSDLREWERTPDPYAAVGVDLVGMLDRQRWMLSGCAHRIRTEIEWAHKGRMTWLPPTTQDGVSLVQA